MSRLAAALQLTRPRQWPILTAQLAVGILLAPTLATGLLSDPPVLPTSSAALASLGGAWLAWVLLLNGGTLAFNSAYDRDTSAVAYLADPPAPPPHLAGISLLAMGLAPVIGLGSVGTAFAGLVAGCVLLSVAYSHPRTRWKGVPGLDLAVNVLGYGAGTTLAGWLAGTAAAAGGLSGLSAPGLGPWLLTAGFGLLFGSLYPLTQLYQLDDDHRRGDRTLSTALGATAALALASGLGLAAAAILLCGAVDWRGAVHGAVHPTTLLPLGVALAAWNIHLLQWWTRRRVWGPAELRRGMYRALVLWAIVDAGLLVSLYWRV